MPNGRKGKNKMNTVFTPEFYALQHQYKTDAGLRKRLKNCHLCGQNIEDRQVALYKSLIRSLYAVYKWCGEHRVHEFTMKDIRHLLGQVNYTRFGDLVRFGGIVYKTGKAHYGLNMARAKEFFAGEREIPLYIVLNQLTNEIMEAKYVKVDQFPDLYSLLTKEGLYDYTKQPLFPQSGIGKIN